ncbi:hypothetical protein CLU79DRAFT_709318 [Phycomyces nitens]|nr:hypothetical protein CLU79DRAFT_709318 [Phycomyces nitens]
MPILSNTSTLSKYMSLNQNGLVQAEFIWVDGFNQLRSKTKTLASKPLGPSDIADWHCSGASTGQAYVDDSDITLHPVAMYPDPFRRGDNILVLCETFDSDEAPLETNYRHRCNKTMQNYAKEEPWFGIEQEYTLVEPESKRPYGWPTFGYPEPQGMYYCGIGTGRIFGRDLIEAHYRACLYAGIKIAGVNVEVAPSQFEYQIGPCGGISMGDELWVARYLLERLAEDFGVAISLHPKPVVEGDWNGAGCHTNYSTAAMRQDGGMVVMEEAIDKMGDRHYEHLQEYGDFNELRLIGSHETGHIDAFSYGIENRGASIRIPRQVAKDGKGYMEDRRPASNIDPYRVTRIIVESTLNPSPFF